MNEKNTAFALAKKEVFFNTQESFRLSLNKCWEDRKRKASLEDLCYGGIYKPTSFRIPYYVIDDFNKFCQKTGLRQGLFITQLLIYSIEKYDSET